MKFIKTFILILFVALIALGGYAFYDYQNVLKKEPPIQTISFNQQEISFQSATVQDSILFGLYPIKQEYIYETIPTLETQNIVNELNLLPEDEVIITDPNNQIENTVGLNQINLENNGLYHIQVNRTIDQTSYIFSFNVQVDTHPIITISNQNPVQGELLIVEIDNIPLNSQIEIKNHFRPSAISQKDYKARFYLPMAYREAAKVYPLTLSINGQEYNYELDVNTYEFKEIHFTVKQTVVSSTVGNNDAVIQYRETIYPLYETFETEEYWEGNFINPVEGARMSSTFGEMRFVNNAKTPTRHAGIDYAIACGT